MVELPNPLFTALEEVRRERIRGAAWSALRVLEGLLDSLNANKKLCGINEKVYGMIIDANPSMSSLYWVATVFKKGCELGDPENYLRKLLFEISEARRKIPDVSLVIFERGTKVLTLSYSSNVELVLRNAFRRGVLGQVIALESRPGGEGINLAQNLKKFGVNIRVVPDSTMHIYLKKVDIIMVGADSITRDGCLVHKVGTELLAREALKEKRPLFVVFEPFKINIGFNCSGFPMITRKYEIEGWGEETYPLFDMTSPELISRGITSEGIFIWEPGKLKDVAESFMRRIFD